MRGTSALAGVLLLTGVVYLSSFPGTFHFDDFPLLLENPRVTGSGFDWSSFLSFYGARPLTLLSFSLNHSLFGPDAFSFHLINVLLHLLAVSLVFLLVRQLIPGDFVCLAAALVFALHPLQTQAVNYVWSRSVLLMTCFGLASLLFARRKPWLAVALFQLAIWSRGDALFLVIFLIWLAPKIRLAASAVAAVNLFWLLGSLIRSSPEKVAWQHPDLTGYWMLQPLVLARYLAKMVWPEGLSIDHEVAVPELWVTVVLSLLLLSIGLFVAIAARRSFALSLGFFWLVLPFVPVALVANSDIFNESRSYCALGGFSLLVAFGLHKAFARPFVRGAVLTCALLLLVPLTLERNHLWNDDVKLWREAARIYPSKDRIRYNLGAALARRGDVKDAEREFRLARNLNPRDDLSYAALGYCAEVKGEGFEAVFLYEKALALNPDNSYARKGVSRVRSGPSGLQSEVAVVAGAHPGSGVQP